MFPLASMSTGGTRRLRSVWVADDSALEAEHARRALEAHYDVAVLPGGAAVLERLADGPLPDALILDWVMPDLSGLEVCSFVRANERTASLPVVLLTSNRGAGDVAEALQAGASDFVAKPFVPDELRARVAGLLRTNALQQQLREADLRLRAALGELPLAILTLDPMGNIAYANAAAEAVLGGGLVGRRGAEVLPGLPPDGRPRDLVIGYATFSVHATLPRVELGGTDQIITLQDVTLARRQESRKLDFYSMIAHDLRSPLSALRLRTHMLLEGVRGELPPPAAVELQKMAARIGDMAKLVNDFLDVAQLETTTYRLEQEPVDVVQLCSDTADEHRALAVERQIDLQTGLETPASVVGDGRRLRQVVTNLLSNAIKFTEAKGCVRLSVATAGRCVKICVADTGRGMDAAAKERIFTKYGRVAEAGSQRTEGTGLGLVIVKELVEAHGGSITFESERGIGTSFTVLLPSA